MACRPARRDEQLRRGYPSLASAATAVRDGTALATAFYEPLTDECCVVVRGEGATLNGDPLSVDPRDRPLSRSTVSLVRGLDAVRDDDLIAGGGPDDPPRPV